MMKINDRAGGKNTAKILLLFLLAAASGFLILANRSDAALPSYVRSIEYVEINISSGSGTGSANLSKSQTVADCVPFMTTMPTALNSDLRSYSVELAFATSPTRVTATRLKSSGSVDLGISVVEFDSTKVRVQTGTFSLSSVSSTTCSIATPVTLNRAAMVFYTASSVSGGSAPDDSMVAGTLSATDTATFERVTTLGLVQGRYFIFEALQNQFSVQASNFTIASNQTIGTGSLSSINTGKTFLLSSLYTDYASDNVGKWMPSVHLTSATQITATRGVSNSSVVTLKAFAVTFAGEETVQRGEFAYSASTLQKTYTLDTPVNMNEAIVWNPSMHPPGNMHNGSINSSNNEDGSQRLKFNPYGNIIQGDRSESTTAASGRWEVIWFKGQATPVRLSSFAATAYEEGTVLLEWKTGYEANNLGFHVYREEGGERIQLTSEPIKGSALMTGPDQANAGFPYAFWDTSLSPRHPALGTVRYWLEDIDLNGARTAHGPVTPELSGEPVPKKQKALLLSRLADGQPRAKRAASRAAALQGRLHKGPPIGTRESRWMQAAPSPPSAPHPAGKAAAPASPPSQAPRQKEPTPREVQWGLAAGPAVKVFVQQEGWYRVSQPELLAAGLPPDANPRFLRLFADGKELAFKVSAKKEWELGPSDYIEFYGTGLDTPHTDTRVYYLKAGSRPGKRILSHPLNPPLRNPHSAIRNPSGSFPFTVEEKPRTIYFAALKNGEAENFFGPLVSPTPADQVLEVRSPDPDSPQDALLEVALQGVTLVPHQVRVLLNGVELGTVAFEGQGKGTGRFPVFPGGLQEGENTVRLISSGSGMDVSLIDFIRLTYWRNYRAEKDLLRFTAAGGAHLTVGGFSSSSVRVKDITDPENVGEVFGEVKWRDDGYAVRLRVPGHGGRTLLAFTEGRLENPAALAANRPSLWNRPANGSDQVIIAHGLFLESLKPLQSLRESQGLSVSLIDVEDLYDEFSFGTKTPQAIKDFIDLAKTAWKSPPRFLLLAGDASFDPRNYYGLGAFDFVPTKLVETRYLETASDGWFADFQGEGLPEMAVGRIPVRTAEEASAVVSKIVGYARSGGRKNEVLLVADLKDEHFDFEAAGSDLAPLFPPDVSVWGISRGRFSDDGQVRDELLPALNAGPLLVNYLGHGSVGVWRGNIFNNRDAESLSNRAHLAFFVNMTCLNGFFQDVFSESLAEALLKARGGGAVAVWTSSGLTEPADQLLMNKELIRLLFSGQELAIGEAAMRAKRAISDRDVRRTWILFGDPATKLNR